MSPAPTDGIIALRPWLDRDVEAMTVACSDPETQRWTKVPDNYTEAHARAFIAASGARRQAGLSLDVGVVDADDHDHVLGAVGLVSIDWQRERAEAGYWTAPHARRRGVATRALRLLSTWALRELPLARLDVMPYADNAASQQVAERAGYTRGGVLRAVHNTKLGPVDIVMFSLLSGDVDG